MVARISNSKLILSVFILGERTHGEGEFKTQIVRIYAEKISSFLITIINSDQKMPHQTYGR